MINFHYTNTAGHKAISSQPDWVFRAAKPPGPHPVGAFFTPLPPSTPRLCAKLWIPREKTEFAFEFSGGDGLIPVKGGRGQHVVYSPTDYVVTRDGGRQRFTGRVADHAKAVEDEK